MIVRMLKLIRLAGKVALAPNIEADPRLFWMGAVGVRGDGVIVSARNGSVKTVETIGSNWSFPKAHAESRCIRKMDYGGTVYVARVSRATRQLVMARPCYDCIIALRSRQVKRVYYSVSESEYGVIDLATQREDERLVNRAPASVQ